MTPSANADAIDITGTNLTSAAVLDADLSAMVSGSVFDIDLDTSDITGSAALIDLTDARNHDDLASDTYDGLKISMSGNFPGSNASVIKLIDVDYSGTLGTAGASGTLYGVYSDVSGTMTAGTYAAGHFTDGTRIIDLADGTYALDATGAGRFSDDLTVTGGDITGANGDSLDIGEAADSTFTFTRNNSGVVTLTAADDDADATLGLIGGGTENVQVSIDADSEFIALATAAPTADMVTIQNSAFDSVTDGVDAMVIDMDVADNTSGDLIHLIPSFVDDDANGVAGDTWNVINIDAFTAQLADDGGGIFTNTLNAFNIGNLTESVGGDETITSTAINIGTGWDVGISFGANSIDGTYFDVAAGSGAVSMVQPDDSSTPALDIDLHGVSGALIDIDYVAEVQTGAISALDIDLTNLTNDNVNNLYGIMLNDFTPAGTGGNLYGIYQQGTNWDYGLYLEDDAYFAGSINQTTTQTQSGGATNITVTLGDDEDGDQVAGLGINATSAATGDADTLAGISIAALTSAQGGITEAAIVIGDSWDSQVYLNDTTSNIWIADTGTLTFEDPSGNDILALTDSVQAADTAFTAATINVTGNDDTAVSGDNAQYGLSIIGADNGTDTTEGADVLLRVLNNDANDGVGVGMVLGGGSGDLITGIDITAVDYGIIFSAATTDITTASNTDLTILPNGTGDTSFSIDADSVVNFTATAAPGVDMVTITNDGQSSATDGVDALAIAYDVGDNTSGSAINISPIFTDDNDDATAGDTWNVININNFNATLTADAGGTFTNILNAFNIGNLTENVSGDENITSTAIKIGTGWDDAINVGSGAFVVDVNGNTTVTLPLAASTTFAVCHDVDGAGTDVLKDCNGGVTADYAEKYPVAQGITYGQIVVPGSKMITTNDDSHGTQQIAQAVLSSEPYQGPVYGIVSNNYGDFTSAGNNIAEQDNPMPVALVGRVPVKVVSENGTISIGDFLTTSSTAGAAMKATEAGRVIGMAMENWNGEKDTIMIQVLNTWYQPPTSQASSLQGSSTDTLLTTGTVTADTLVVSGDASFEGSVKVAKHVYAGQDVAGRAKILSGDDRVEVTFADEYTYQPIVTATIRGNEAQGLEDWWIEEESTTGFIIRLDGTLLYDVEFNWIAMGVDAGKISISNGTTSDIEVYVKDGVIAESTTPILPEETPSEPVEEESTTTEETVVEEEVVNESTSQEELSDDTSSTDVQEPVVEAEPIANVVEEEVVEAVADQEPVVEESFDSAVDSSVDSSSEVVADDGLAQE